LNPALVFQPSSDPALLAERIEAPLHRGDLPWLMLPTQFVVHFCPFLVMFGRASSTRSRRSIDPEGNLKEYIVCAASASRSMIRVHNFETLAISL